MDDTFTFCRHSTLQPDVLKQFNVEHLAIRFIYEEESKVRITVLDVLLTKRADGSIIQNLNRKSTWTEPYTPP